MCTMNPNKAAGFVLVLCIIAWLTVRIDNR
jgi:hypothetical protein